MNTFIYGLNLYSPHTLFPIGWLVLWYKNFGKRLRTGPRRKAQDNESN